MNRISVYFLLLFSLFIFIHFAVPFNGLYGQDAFEYLRYAGRLRNAVLTGQAPGDYFWPIGFPLYGALLSFIFQDVSFSLQLVSFLGFLSCFYYSNKILEHLYPENKNCKNYLFLFLVFSPLFLRASLLVMSDMGCAGFITAAFYYSLKYFSTLKSKYILIFIFCFANAAMFRYASFIILLPVFAWSVFNWFQKKNILQLLSGILLLVIIFLPHYFIKNENPLSLVGHQRMNDWSFVNLFQRDFANPDGHIAYLFPNGMYCLLAPFYPGYFSAGLLFIFFSVKNFRLSFFEKIILFSSFLYIVFLMFPPAQNNRFFLLAIPLLVISGFKGFNFLLTKIAFNKNYLYGLVLIIQIFLFFYSSKTIFERNRLERTIFNYIQKETKQNVFYSFDMDISLKGYGLQKQFYNMWENKYEKFEHNSLVLFNPKGFEKQWTGFNPMINWEKINKEYHLKPIKEFNKGWVLYEIK